MCDCYCEVPLMKKTALVICLYISIFAAFGFMSCYSVPTKVAEGISEAELLQLGQNSLDNGNYKAAEFYYNKVIELYGSNMSSAVQAEYELAHILIKRRHYKEAKPALEKILSYYNNPQNAALLPPAYKKLAQIDLKKCEDAD